MNSIITDAFDDKCYDVEEQLAELEEKRSDIAQNQSCEEFNKFEREIYYPFKAYVNHYQVIKEIAEIYDDNEEKFSVDWDEVVEELVENLKSSKTSDANLIEVAKELGMEVFESESSGEPEVSIFDLFSMFLKESNNDDQDKPVLVPQATESILDDVSNFRYYMDRLHISMAWKYRNELFHYDDDAEKKIMWICGQPEQSDLLNKDKVFREQVNILHEKFKELTKIS